jgi:predicted transcriptional regulator
MITDFRVLAPGDPLSRAVDLTLAGAQKDFPVVLEGRIAGVLSQAAILRGLRDLGAAARVEQVMAAAETADVATPLAALLDRMRQADARLVLMTRDGRLAGIVDLDNVAEFLRIQQVLGR